MNKILLFRLCTLIAILLIIGSYFSPIWWVSLKAPNYPAEAFPDGIRIHFHVNGVFNGCRARQSKEVEEDAPLDCVREMDTINHYIGMYPIASGGPIERALSSFLFSFLIVLLLAFMLSRPKTQATVLSICFSIIILWMWLALSTSGGVTWMSTGYQKALANTLDREHREFRNWSGIRAMKASYRKSLGEYFRNTKAIEDRVATVITATYVVIGLLIASMLIFVAGILWKNIWFYRLLILIPMLLPVFFVLEYAGWLWWFGHHLNEMGAFTVKPFMPTVFGDGRVAQFTTHSYPHYGFGLMLLSSLFLLIAAGLRHSIATEQE